MKYLKTGFFEILGGPGSGHHGHAGRKGRRGGSAPKSSGSSKQPVVYVSPSDLEERSIWGEKYNVHRGTGETIKGRILTKDDLPDILYHVTTNAPAVEKSGSLKSFHSGERAAGLGKGTSAAHQGVSLTTDKATAQMIHRELLRFGEIARGVDFDAKLVKWARQDEKIAGLKKGALDPAVKESKWWLDQQKKFYGEKANTPSYHKDAMNQYLNRRESLKGPENPIIYGDIKSFAGVTPKTTRILSIPKTNIPDNALIREPGIGLKEVMVHSEIPIKRR